MEFQIRKAVTGDFKEISKLFHEILAYHCQALPQVFKPVKDTRSHEMLTDMIADKNVAMFVAVYNGKVIGLVNVHIKESPDIPVMVKRRYVYVSDIIVTEKYRGSSAGR